MKIDRRVFCGKDGWSRVGEVDTWPEALKLIRNLFTLSEHMSIHAQLYDDQCVVFRGFVFRFSEVMPDFVRKEILDRPSRVVE